MVLRIYRKWDWLNSWSLDLPRIYKYLRGNVMNYTCGVSESSSCERREDSQIFGLRRARMKPNFSSSGNSTAWALAMDPQENINGTARRDGDPDGRGAVPGPYPSP